MTTTNVTDLIGRDHENHNSPQDLWDACDSTTR